MKRKIGKLRINQKIKKKPINTESRIKTEPRKKKVVTATVKKIEVKIVRIVINTQNERKTVIKVAIMIETRTGTMNEKEDGMATDTTIEKKIGKRIGIKTTEGKRIGIKTTEGKKIGIKTTDITTINTNETKIGIGKKQKIES